MTLCFPMLWPSTNNWIIKAQITKLFKHKGLWVFFSALILDLILIIWILNQETVEHFIYLSYGSEMWHLKCV